MKASSTPKTLHSEHESPDQPTSPGPDDNPVVCHCMVIEEATIKAAIQAGAHTLEAVQDETYANTGCGTCRLDVQRLLAAAGHPCPEEPEP